MTGNLKFIVDHNVGKLVKWLRIMGYDTVFFEGTDDSLMVAQALNESRILLTRDTQIMQRKAVASGKVRAVLLTSEEPEAQMEQLIDTLKLECKSKPFTICLECNEPLVERNKEEVKDRVPPYVFKTQNQYRECPRCHRIYWRGTHWNAMTDTLKKFIDCMEREEK